MFYNCSSIEELNLTNFNINVLTYVNSMFSGCSSLKELKLFNFLMDNDIDMNFIFSGCSNELKNKIKEQNKNINKY